MKIVGVYSFNGAKKAFASSPELEEVKKIISLVNSSKHKTKISKEKTMPGRKLYKPDSLNKAFTKLFTKKGWNKHKVSCDYCPPFFWIISPGPSRKCPKNLSANGPHHA